MNRQLIQAAHAAWCAAAERRQRRRRFIRYTYGDQWGDIVRDNSGHYITEGELIARSGRQPLVNNLIRRLVKSLVGRRRSLASSATTALPDAVSKLNNIAELDSRLFEEFLISGCAVQRVAFDSRPSGTGVWIDNVCPDRFIAGPFTDSRGTDVEMVGMLHDMSFSQVLARFGDGSPDRAKWLAAVYGDIDRTWSTRPLTAADNGFFVPADSAKCRVVELWTLDAVESAAGMRFDWRCRWLSPGGELLASHGVQRGSVSHPFMFKFYPFTDGEVHSFVEDVIDQQRYVNRLIVMIDKMMGVSAKGVLLFPQSQKVRDFSWEDISRSWAATDGVIPITGNSQILPQQVVGNGADAGAHKLLEMELKLFEDVSGVSDAFFGKVNSASTGSDLYQSQVSNSVIALADLFETFSDLTARRDQRAAAIHSVFYHSNTQSYEL